VKNTLSKEMLFQQGAAPSHFRVSFQAGLLRIEIFLDSGFAEAVLSLGNLVSLTLQALVFCEYAEDSLRSTTVHHFAALAVVITATAGACTGGMFTYIGTEVHDMGRDTHLVLQIFQCGSQKHDFVMNPT
jgi:hypothetical protein